MKVAELKDLEWEKYRLLNTKDGYNSDKVLKLINFKNQYDIEFAFNKLRNENLIFDKNDKEESIRTTLYKSKFGCQLFILNKYIKNKIHYAKHILQVNSNNSDELSVLLQIYEKVESNPSLIDKIHLYYTYATRKQEKSYAVSNEFNLKLLDEIFNKDFIKKNVIKSNLFECISKQYNETNEYILGIYFPSDYQRIAETYEKPITYNPKESFIIYYDSKNNNFVFRGSTKYAAKYKSEIEKALNTKLYEWDDVVDYDAIDNIIKGSDLFQNIPLEYILSYNNVDGKKIVEKHVVNSYNDCLQCANVLVENGAKLSLQNTEDVINAYKNIYGKACDLFEVDVYNLIHYAFRNAKQLGKKKRGKSVADGYFDINIIQTSGVNETKKYTLMWDAKYSELEGGYDFSVGEKRKIADYISNAIENYELTNYSSQNTLDAFLIVYNNMDCKKFEQISKDIRSKIKGDWSGKLVFIDLTAIRTIVKYISSIVGT